MHDTGGEGGGPRSSVPGMAEDGEAAQTTAPAPLVVTSVTIATGRPLAVADFFARMLRTELSAREEPAEGDPEEAGWAQLRTGADVGRPLTLNFEFEEHFTPPVWPAQEGRQSATAHLDIWVQDLDDATAWALECGASLDPVQPQPTVRVLRDPAGHPFCLFA